MNTKTPLARYNGFSCENVFKRLQYKNRWPRFYTLFVMLFFFSVSQGQSINKNWKEDLTLTLEQFLKCTSTESNKAVCVSFIEKSIAAVYTLDAINAKASTQLSPGLANMKGGQWSVVGMAFDQRALETAQHLANENKAVIAVYKPSGEIVKHVALILPGEVQYSGSWGYNVPNSASFFITTPDKSYMNKGLSYAFAKSMLLQVTLYVRNN